MTHPVSILDDTTLSILDNGLDLCSLAGVGAGGRGLAQVVVIPQARLQQKDYL